MDFIKDFLESNFKPWWDSKDKNSKILTASFGIAGLVALIVSLIFLVRPSYETLYLGLETDEAAQVVEKLVEYKVSYRLKNGGTTVQVPRKDIYDIRLKLASEGLPRSGSLGYEILDESKLGMTEFLQKINYRRALEGEISKSISGINGVKSARVHIVIPEPRLFKEDKKEVSEKDIWKLLRDTYKNEHFIRFVKSKKGVFRYPEPKILAGSNYCDIGFELDRTHGRLVLVCAIDNLMKGAAGSAMQCMNVIFDFDETKGLEFPGLHPV